MSPKKTSGAESAPAPEFDASLERLEQIVRELEEGGLGLEVSLERYKEGVGLLKGCRTRLASFKAQVEELTAEGMAPYPGDPDTAPAQGRSGRSGPAPAGPSEGPPAGSSAGPADGIDTPF